MIITDRVEKKNFDGDFFFLIKRSVCFLYFVMVCFYFISQSTGNYVIVLTLYMEELWNKIYFRCFMPLSHLNVFYLYLLF